MRGALLLAALHGAEYMCAPRRYGASCEHSCACAAGEDCDEGDTPDTGKVRKGFVEVNSLLDTRPNP